MNAQRVPRGTEPYLLIVVSCSAALPLFLWVGKEMYHPDPESLSSGSNLVPELSHLRSCLSWVSHMW